MSNPSSNTDSDTRCAQTRTCRGISTITINDRSGNSNRSSSGGNGSRGYGSRERSSRTNNGSKPNNERVNFSGGYRSNGSVSYDVNYPMTYQEFQNNSFWAGCAPDARGDFNQLVHNGDLIFSENPIVETVQINSGGNSRNMKGIKVILYGKQSMFTGPGSSKFNLAVYVIRNDGLYYLNVKLRKQLFSHRAEYIDAVRKYNRSHTYSRRNHPRDD